jgi:hypothetical protein
MNDNSEDKNIRLKQETQYVYSRGLVALSLFGNQLTGNGILSLTNILKKNFWLLGKHNNK